MAIDFSSFDFSSIGVNGPNSTTQPKKKELGQEEFMRLMIEQFRHQDPFKPMENGEFIGQLVQFSSVAGLAELKQSFADLSASLTSNQTLQASSLLGRDVLVENSKVPLGATGGVEGAMELSQNTTSAVVHVVDSAGATVRKIYLGEQKAGMTNFAWDGTTDGGARAAAGNYTFKAYALDGSESAQMPVLTKATVESVTLGAGRTGITLSVSGLGEVAFGRVRQIS